MDLFSTSPTQIVIESSTTHQYNPISVLNDGAPIEFLIPSSNEEYIDGSSITVHTRVKIVRGDDGTPMLDDSQVGPINLIGHTMWSDVEVTIQNTRVNPSDGCYAYKAYIPTLLGYGNDAKKSQLQSALYYKDSAWALNNNNPVPNGCENHGIKQRWALMHPGAIELENKIFCDLFMQPKLILDKIPIKIKLTQNKSSFCLMTNQPNRLYKLVVVDCYITCRKVKVSGSAYLAHNNTLDTGNANYNIRRTAIKTFTIPRGQLSSVHENVFTGQLPARLVFGLVSNTGFNGSYAENALNFHHYDIKEFNVTVDGVQGLIIKPIKLDVTNGIYLDGYMSLFSATGQLSKNTGIDIQRNEYLGGYTLFAFDLSPDMSEDDNVNLIKSGSIRLSIQFGTVTPHTINVITFSEHESVIEINKNRDVILDY